MPQRGKWPAWSTEQVSGQPGKKMKKVITSLRSTPRRLETHKFTTTEMETGKSPGGWSALFHGTKLSSLLIHVSSFKKKSIYLIVCVCVCACAHVCLRTHMPEYMHVHPRYVCRNPQRSEEATDLELVL